MDCGDRTFENSGLSSSCREFSKKCRRISIKNMPPGINNQDISDLLKPYHYQQIHIDKMSLSCKAVLLDGDSACQCMNELHLKPFRGSRLIVSLASCDFMLCVTQLPPSYTWEQFVTLITPFGTPERCFLVHSEVNGQSKGYGCVEFTSKESSIKAKNHLNGKAIGPYTLQVHWLDTIPQSYSGLHSSCLLVENLPNSFKDPKALGELFTYNIIKPVFFQSANCAENDFSVIEYASPANAETMWQRMNNHKIGPNVIRVSFCVPGPCGLVILNSLKASRDLKRNNPSGGLLPTPVQKLDLLQQYQIRSGVASQVPTTLPLMNGTLAHAVTHSDPEVQRLLKALQVRLLNVPNSSSHQPPPELGQDMNGAPSHNQPVQPSVQIATDPRFTNQAYDPAPTCLMSSHSGMMSSSRVRSASYDSGVHATDDEVFSSGSSSQEDIGRPQDHKDQPMSYFRGRKWNSMPQTRPESHFKSDYASAFCHISGQNESNRPFPLYQPGVFACQREDLQRSDSADSAYGGSQDSTHSMTEQHITRTQPLAPFHYLFNSGQTSVGQPIPSSCEQYQRPLPMHPGRDCQDGIGGLSVNGMPRPEFLFSSLCKGEEQDSKTKAPSGLLNAGPVGSAFTQHRSHLPRTPVPDQSSPCFRQKMSLSTLRAGLHDIGADSPTQLQLLGSSLMEGLLGDSPHPGVESLSETANGNSGTGRLIRALNLFSPTECLNSPQTPAPVRKRGCRMLPSPEPSPEAGAYVGQHSQGLGGHYAGPLFSGLSHYKRRRSNET